ncbi:MAG: hypothetical protein U1C33_02905, partial [Candidatus Cloacimonadaceae bacterium]|nr:hypothetical protein [Candidatus Cloacimonadaceae bacterium]
ELHFQGLVSSADVRNGILFPQKFDDCYLRFERPNRTSLENGVKTGTSIVCSTSKDLFTWEEKAVVMQGRPHFWDELIGSGPPPIKTHAGWLHIYHGVATHFGSSNIYQAGVALHDLNEPWKVLARGKYNILEPRENYELCGQVPNVIFPTALWVHPHNADNHILKSDVATPESKVYLYYGAADTSVCMAETTIATLLEEVYAQ